MGQERITEIQLLCHRVKISLEAPEADRITTETCDKTIECLRRITLSLDQELEGGVLAPESYSHDMIELLGLAIQISLELRGVDN